MNIMKTKNGYRIRETRKGKRYSVNIDHKPTQREALELIMFKESSCVPESKLLKNACEEYCNSKDKSISASTLMVYRRMVRNMCKNYSIMHKEIDKIKKIDFQKFVNEYSDKHSPKSVRNAYFFLLAVMRMFIDGYNCRVTLPQKIKLEPYIPNDDDIKFLLDNAKGTIYEIPIRLAMNGLRKSEIMALTMEDIKDGIVSVNKAKVKGDNGYVIKTTKTYESTRDVNVGKELTDMIKKQGYIWNKDVDGVSRYMLTLQRGNNRKTFSLHKLRHWFCSISAYLGIPQIYTQKEGGWQGSDNSVMKRVYLHPLNDKDFSKVRNDYIKALTS